MADDNTRFDALFKEIGEIKGLLQPFANNLNRAHKRIDDLDERVRHVEVAQKGLLVRVGAISAGVAAVLGVLFRKFFG